jgi:hypothetical protein
VTKSGTPSSRALISSTTSPQRFSTVPSSADTVPLGRAGSDDAVVRGADPLRERRLGLSESA